MKRRTKSQPVTLSPGVEYRDVQGGRFKVTRNGEVVRVAGDKYFTAAVSKTCNGRYLSTSYYENGMQTHYYIHRLIAEAFIPNPDGYTMINHLDGNGQNNSVENLEWCTASQNVRHAYETGLVNSYLCKLCGAATFSTNMICRRCRINSISETKRAETVLKRSKSVAHINTESLSGRCKKATELRAKGMTLQQIGNELGVTREWVRQLLASAKKDVEESMNDGGEYKTEVIALRKRNRLLKADVAKLLDVSIPTYSKIEKNPEKAKISHIIKLCELYNVTFDMLVPDILTKIS